MGKLGYPRRAQRLHACAKAIATEHDNVVPDDVDALLALPGVGEYTARAVACFAYGQPVPVVDTNVRRVIARACHGLADAPGPRRPISTMRWRSRRGPSTVSSPTPRRGSRPR